MKLGDTSTNLNLNGATHGKGWYEATAADLDALKGEWAEGSRPHKPYATSTASSMVSGCWITSGFNAQTWLTLDQTSRLLVTKPQMKA